MRLLFGLLALWPPLLFALDSVRLTDVIKSNGQGDIALLKDVTPTALELLRVEGNGVLLFAVDINENASGTEKSSSQGVALQSVELRAVINGSTLSFTSYSTETQALLAQGTQLTRAPFFTLIGDAGSNRITSNQIQQQFDSVLSVPVNVDLSTASSVLLLVRLATTNVSLGDPELFYDFTNGFEDIALLNSTDATFLNQLAPGQDEAPGVILTNPPEAPVGESWLSYPSATSFYTVGYEDLYPHLGDYDFNDLLVAYRVEVGLDAQGEVVTLKMTAFLLARGAGYSHDWRLRISSLGSGSIERTLTMPDSQQTLISNGSFSGGIEFLAFEDTRALFPPVEGSFTNTVEGSPFSHGPRVDITINLFAPLPLSSLAPPFDPYLFVRETGYEVHLAGQLPMSGSLNEAEGLLSFVDPRGYPFALLLPGSWQFPWERVSLEAAYPELGSYVLSNETELLDWYTRPDAALVRTYSQSDWEWAAH